MLGEAMRVEAHPRGVARVAHTKESPNPTRAQIKPGLDKTPTIFRPPTPPEKPAVMIEQSLDRWTMQDMSWALPHRLQRFARRLASVAS